MAQLSWGKPTIEFGKCGANGAANTMEQPSLNVPFGIDLFKPIRTTKPNLTYRIVLFYVLLRT